jgi:electron transfer flavoprotein beta subunit
VRILVAIKQVISPDLPANLFEIDPVELRQRADRLPLVASVYDEHALEVALQLRDRHGASVAVVTMGGEPAVKVLRKALAMGAGHAIRIDPAGVDDRDPAVAAALLAEVTMRQAAGLLLCGCQSADWGWEQTGPLAAEILGWPCVTFASAVEQSGDALLVTRPTIDGREVLRVRVPAVITITSGEGNLPRLAQVRAVLHAERQPIQVLYAGKDLAGRALWPSARIVDLCLPASRSTCVMVEGEGPVEQARQLVAALQQRRLI